jgi:hypothetical protein
MTVHHYIPRVLAFSASGVVHVVSHILTLSLWIKGTVQGNERYFRNMAL